MVVVMLIVVLMVTSWVSGWLMSLWWYSRSLRVKEEDGVIWMEVTTNDVSSQD